jgi:hypothetical protein
MSAFETEASGHKLSMRVKATAKVFIEDTKDIRTSLQTG